MRWGAAVLLGLTVAALAGCTANPQAPAATRTAASSGAAPSATPAVSLTADGSFEVPIVCRAVVDYETVQAAIATNDLTRLRTVAKAAAADDAAGLAANRAHTWAPEVAPLIPAYVAKVAEQVQYFRDVAATKTVAAATALQWPDGTVESSPVFSAIGITGSLSCPKP